MKLHEIIAKRDELRDKVSTAQAMLDTAKQELAEFEAKEVSYSLDESEPEVVETKKIAPKAKVKATAQVIKETVTKAKKSTPSVAADRPPLKKAMIAVMEDKVMASGDIMAALEAKGWVPASNDPRQYVSFMLSSNSPEVFERTEKRGHYRVRPGYLAAQGPKSKNGKKTNIDENLQESWGASAKPGNVVTDPYNES